jgi:hypothetical protein
MFIASSFLQVPRIRGLAARSLLDSICREIPVRASRGMRYTDTSKQFSLHAEFYGAPGVIRKCLRKFIRKSSTILSVQAESFAPEGEYI